MAAEIKILKAGALWTVRLYACEVYICSERKNIGGIRHPHLNKILPGFPPLSLHFRILKLKFYSDTPVFISKVMRKF